MAMSVGRARGAAIAEMLAPGSLTVLIQADREASYSALAPVLAACRLAGVGEIALATELQRGR